MGLSPGTRLGLYEVIGAIVVGIFTAFYGYFVIDKSAQPADSISRSFTLVKENFGTVLGFLIIVNILFGFAIPNIDNAAHIGGLITGMWIGALWAPTRIQVTSYWQRAREADATRRATLALVIPILVIGVVALVVLAGLLIGAPRFA